MLAGHQGSALDLMRPLEECCGCVEAPSDSGLAGPAESAAAAAVGDFDEDVQVDAVDGGDAAAFGGGVGDGVEVEGVQHGLIPILLVVQKQDGCWEQQVGFV